MLNCVEYRWLFDHRFNMEIMTGKEVVIYMHSVGVSG